MKQQMTMLSASVSSPCNACALPGLILPTNAEQSSWTLRYTIFGSMMQYPSSARPAATAMIPRRQ